MKTSSIAKKFSVDEYVNRFFCFMEYVDEGVLVVDANTRAVLKANSSAARLSGFALPELQNLHIDDLHTSEELPLLLLEIQRLEFEKQTEIEDFELRHKNGWKCPVDIRLCRLVQEDEEFEHKFFVAFYHFESAEESEPDFSKRNKELVALMEVGQTIASALNFDEILDLTMLKLASVCNARYVSLFLKDDDGSLRMHKAHKNPPEEVSIFDQPWRIGIEEGPYENVDEQNRILQVENVFTDDSFQQWRPIAERIGFGAILSVAMIPRKTSLGVFNVYYEKPKKFTEEEINFLRTAVTYLSISIENARLYKEYQDKADQISAINEITNSINSSLELEEVIKTVALEVKKIMEYDYISISLFDEDSAGLNLYSLGSENLGSKLGEDTWRRLGDFALGWLCTGVKTEKADASAGGELASDYEAKSTIEKELQSKMNVLLLSKDKYLGTFSIGKMERYTYTNTHQTLFKQIAGQVATALENAKLYQEAKRRLTEISALADVSTTITSSLNIREVLDLIVKAAAKAMHAKICMIWFVGDTLHPSRYSNDTDDSFSELEKAFRDKVERVAREKEPLIIDDLRQEDLPDKDVPDFMVPNVLRSYLGVPVISREKTIAVLSVYKEDSHHFDEREVKLLGTIANHAAIAIDNARLYERERRRAAQLAMVNEVGKQITTTLDLDRLLDIVTNSIREIFSYYHVSIYLVDSETQLTKLQSQAGRGSFALEIDLGQQGEDNPISRAIRSGDTILIPDLSQESEFERGKSLEGSLLGMPLRVADRVNGCLVLHSERKNAIDKRDLHAFQALASQVASAIENARLFEETKTNSEKLSRVNEELENFVSTVSHDLKTPIVSVLGFTTLLLNEFCDDLSPEGAHYLQRIHTNITQMERLIKDLLELSRIGHVVTPFELVDINEIVTIAAANLHYQAQEKNIKIQYPEDFPKVNCDRTRILQVFTNLIDNAVKYTDKPEEPLVKIGHKRDDDNFIFFVQDNGIGIAKEYHDRVFELFQSLSEIKDVEGTGVGLTIVKRIIENHNGRVWVRSKKGKGATFYISIPME